MCIGYVISVAYVSDGVQRAGWGEVKLFLVVC